MSIQRLMPQTTIAGDHSSRGKTLDREDGFQLLAVSVQEMIQLSIEEFTTWLQIHLLKLESARNEAIAIRGVHDVATDTSAETRMVEGKLDALVNLVTQLAVNRKPTSVARHPRVNKHPEAYAANMYSRRPQQQRPDTFHEVATDTSAETRKVKGKLDALVNLVTQLALNQKPASVARVCDIRSTNDHHTNRRWLPTPSSFSARNDAIVIKGVHDVAIDTSAETRKVEGKLDALVNLVTYLAVNQKPASVARQPGVNENPEAYAANIYSRPRQQYRPETLDREDGFQLIAVSVQEMIFIARNDAIVIRGVHDLPTDKSAETRKAEGKLDALVNMVTQLALNQKPASVARVCGICHDISIGQTLDREDGFQLLAVSVQEMMPLSLEEFTTWLQIHLLKLERWKAS
ncbi:hypothetical protein Fmac_024860 [Flemingia macrophylla]|uniref:Uncharacterized protein n=1 Tax=Flemingia macrophylla TaxID=520843 RepID=A0ABD1LQK7_9FABA